MVSKMISCIVLCGLLLSAEAVGRWWSFLFPLEKPKQEPYDEQNDECHDVAFVELLNRFKTFDVHAVKIGKMDELLLASVYRAGTENAVLKEKALAKYKRKMQSLQCTNAVIVKIMMAHIVQGQARSVCGKFYTYVCRMLSVFCIGKTAAAKWLWTVHARLTAAVINRNDNVIIFEDDKKLDRQLANYVTVCVDNDYLPATVDSEPLIAAASYNPDVFVNNILRGLYDNGHLVYAYRLAGSFTLARLYWTALDSGKLFGPIPAVFVDWTETKVTVDTQMTVTGEFLNAAKWIDRPFDRLEHLEFTVKAIRAKLVCYTWVHLTVYKLIRRQINSSPPPTTDNLEDYLEQQKSLSKYLLIYHFVLIHNEHLLDIENDKFFKKILHYHTADRLNDRTLDVLIKQSTEILNISLMELGAKGDVNPELLSTDREKIDTKTMETNIDSLKQFIQSIRASLFPVTSLYFFKFFHQGSFKCYRTFYFRDQFVGKIVNSSY